MSPYNTTELDIGNNFIQKLLVLNSWDGGIIFTMLIFTAVLVMFLNLMSRENSIDESLIASGFIGFLIAGIGWLITFEGSNGTIYRLLPTYAPIVMLIILLFGIIMRLLKNSLN